MMSKSRKFKFRPASRAHPPPSALFRNEDVASVPLANKFKELVEQDDFVEQIQAPLRNGTPTTMAQRLQEMLGEAENHQYHQPVERNRCSAGDFCCPCSFSCKFTYTINGGTIPFCFCTSLSRIGADEETDKSRTLCSEDAPQRMMISSQ